MNIVSLDIGGTNVRAAILNEEGVFLEVIKELTLRHNKEAFIHQVLTVIQKLNLAKYNPIGVSIGVPGRVRLNGYIDELPNIGIKDIDLVTPLTSALSLPVVIRNDAQVAAFAEAHAGVGKDVKSTYFVTISTGIGGCLVVNHVIKNPSQEIGHTLVPYKNNFYELEKIASGDGILKLAQLNNLDYTSPSSIFTDYASGNPQATRLFNDWLDLIVDFFKYINEAFTPDVIAVTGGVLKSKVYFFDLLLKRVPTANIQIAHFSEDAGLVGAAAYGFKYFTMK